MPKTDKTEELPFEEAMKRLEAIVDAMEAGDLPLETLMAQFEEGTRLAKVCQAKLSAAEVRVQQIEKGAADELTLTSFEAEHDKQ